MYGTGTKKMLNMLILDVLKRYSDQDHKLTQQEIMRILKREFDMDCDRRSVKNNVESLIEMGYEISMDGGYALLERDLDDAELRMLIDSVLFSSTLSEKQSKILINKLVHMGSNYFKAKVSHISSLPNLKHTDNKQTIYALDALNDAIDMKKKVEFVYNEYGTDFKLYPKREETYIVNPYQMVACNGRYYLIGNYDKYDNVSHYRVDRMTSIRILEDSRKPMKQVQGLENGFNLPRHMAEHVYMFSGESVDVTMLAETHLMSQLVDWFGKDFRILENNDGVMMIRVRMNESAMRFWALQYGPYVEILEPEGLRDWLKGAIIGMSEKYNHSNNEGV